MRRSYKHTHTTAYVK
uniref:Paramyosin-related family protein n=1 Tax=Rhizophora mucronata TaxID=61149 RepID=A0A2P2KPZ0_RHIMU